MICRKKGVGTGTIRGKAFEGLASFTKFDNWIWVGRLDNGFFPKLTLLKIMLEFS